MSILALDEGALTDAQELTRKVRDAIKEARDDRKRYEPTWHSNLAFAAGKFWLQWDIRSRSLAFPPELVNRELYSTDVITEYRTTALGELNSDDSRPQLLLRRDDQPSEDYQKILNMALEWGWDYEWNGDAVLSELRRMCLDYGTAAIRCRFDPTVGPVIGEIPHVGGLPVLDPEQARELLGAGPREDVEMRPIRQGRIVWETLSAFNLIVPPGIPNEADFPWECVVRPALLENVKAEYGAAADDLKEDTDIGSLHGISSNDSTGSVTIGPEGSQGSKLKGHVWLFTYYERQSPKYPRGRVMVFGSNKMKPLSVSEKLPYVSPSGDPISGISYFHWWRVTGRFWSRGLVEAMKDPQRIVNKRRTQINDIIDRGLPAVFVERNSQAKERKGLAVELIEIEPNERAPIEFKGISPGEWMYHDVQEMRVDIEHATGIRGPRLGENPVNVTTYAQLALLNENDQVKRQSILTEHKAAIGKLIEASVYDMRTYWGSERVLTVVGEDEMAESVAFNATRIPPFFIVKVAKGATKPRSQAAELKKIEDIWNAAVATSAYMESPHDWVEWLKDSLEQGQALDLPEGGADAHADKAELENSLLLAGQQIIAKYYDPHGVHIPIHREAEIEAELAGDVQLWASIEEHIQSHVLMAQQTAQIMQSMTPPEPLPLEQQGAPNGPGESPGLEAQAGPEI